MPSSTMPTWQLYTVQNQTVNYSLSYGQLPPLARRQGFNIIQRVATGAYEYLPVGMPHPDSAQAAPLPSAPAPAPQLPPANQPPLSPSQAPAVQTITLVNDGFVDVPPTVQGGGYSVTQTSGTAPPENKSGLLWVLVALAAAVGFGG